MTTPALLPCLFCGGTASLDDSVGGLFVECDACEARGPFVCCRDFSGASHQKAKSEAVAAWNQHKDWQPIETAPRDGTKFLAWDGDELLIAWWCDGGRWISDNLQQYHPGEYENPTHWQPLPSTPPITP